MMMMMGNFSAGGRGEGGAHVSCRHLLHGPVQVQLQFSILLPSTEISIKLLEYYGSGLKKNEIEQALLIGLGNALHVRLVGLPLSVDYITKYSR